MSIIQQRPDLTDPALSFARQSLYRFAALTLVDPKTDSWQQLADRQIRALLTEAAEILRDEALAKPEMLAVGEQPLEQLDPASVFSQMPLTEAELNTAYESTFGLLVSSGCPPYETEYIGDKFTFQRSHTLADISGFYHAFGLKPSTAHPERHDHIVLELEFMAFLIGRQRQASEDNDPDREQHGTVCTDAQVRFFREHLVWWAPAFARLLSHEVKGGYYGAVANFLAALITAERALLGVEPTNRTVAPSQVDRPDECEGCLLGS